MGGNEACGPTLSKRIWNLEWGSHLPWTFGDVAVEAGTFRNDAAPFISAHYTAIFSESGTSRFYVEQPGDPKARFGDEMDVLQFRQLGRTVGLLVGHPSDWSTYYFRSVALLPEIRDRRLLEQTLERAHEVLRGCGVERVEGECSPMNTPMLRALTKLDYFVTATVASERWGTVVRLTKFLQPAAEDVFARQFCAMRVKSA